MSSHVTKSSTAPHLHAINSSRAKRVHQICSLTWIFSGIMVGSINANYFIRYAHAQISTAPIILTTCERINSEKPKKSDSSSVSAAEHLTKLQLPHIRAFVFFSQASPSSQRFMWSYSTIHDPGTPERGRLRTFEEHATSVLFLLECRMQLRIPRHVRRIFWKGSASMTQDQIAGICC
jgi:hypothetical protein